MLAILFALSVAIQRSLVLSRTFADNERPARPRKPIGKFFCLVVLCAFALLQTTRLAHAQANDAVLYFFTNDGCAPCLMVEPAILGLHKSGYPVRKVKVSQHPQFADQLGVDRTPTVVMIRNNRVTHRYAGLIKQGDLEKWFAEVGFRPANVAQQTLREPRVTPTPDPRPAYPGSDGDSDDRKFVPLPGQRDPGAGFSSPTMHTGTRTPETSAERNALLATVKLRVEDAEGSSFATGTVIHTHGNESLVMTCGHVFRDSAGQGRITAEYDFYGERGICIGRLVDYDSDARDVGLVVIKTDRPLPAVPLAKKYARVDSGLDVFSIGCDRGDDPTIRHTRIKNQATYDGSLKYDIYGRPVQGRSGGGLFTRSGELIGVCNSAAVEVDEGIYTALETLHWQVASTGLSHLFEGAKQTIARADPTNPSRRLAEVPSGRNALARQLKEARESGIGRPSPDDRSSTEMLPISPISPVVGSRRLRQGERQGYEVEIVVRSKQDPRRTETIMINDPTPELIQYLGRMNER